ncbi:MAG: carbohydrate ABC transporter permease [Bacteroidota bacterium]
MTTKSEYIPVKSVGSDSRSPILNFIIYSSAILLAVVILAPFVWLLISAISTKAELLSNPIHWLPPHPTLMNFQKLFMGGMTSISGGEIPPFHEAIRNSLVVSLSATLFCLIIGALAAYAFARLNFWLKKQLLIIVIAIRMLPEIALVVPLYILMRTLHLMDTPLVLILVYTSFLLPFIIWLLKSYFESIPKELEEAAYVDGASRIQILGRIILPLSVPGLITSGIFALLTAWDEFLFALIFTSTYNAKTIPVSISEFTTRHMIDYSLMTAGGLIAALPPIVFTLLLQKYIINGLTAGAVKE